MMLPLLLLGGGVASLAQWAPSAKCQAAADHACNADPSIFGPKVDHGHSCYVDIHSRPCDGPMMARKSGAIGQSERLWRCYSPSTLKDGNYSSGTCYCSLDAPLRGVLAKCGDPDPTPPPTPAPPPPPPALPKLGSSVFISGKEGYHTYRIPAIVSNSGGKLLCFAEGRKLSSADHGWNDIVAKRSEDGGASWQPLQLVYGESTTAKPVTIGNPAPVAVGTTGKIVLVFCKNNLEVGVMTSLDFGGSWGKPRYIQSANPPHGKNGSWPWLATGPPQGLQLRSGRLVVGSDHRGFPASDHALVYSHAMYPPRPGSTKHVYARRNIWWKRTAISHMHWIIL